jgi:hypothetical protein
VFAPLVALFLFQPTFVRGTNPFGAVVKKKPMNYVALYKRPCQSDVLVWHDAAHGDTSQNETPHSHTQERDRPIACMGPAAHTPLLIETNGLATVSRNHRLRDRA